MTDEHFEQARKAAYKAAQYLSDSGENGGTEPQPELVKAKENRISPANTEENEWADEGLETDFATSSASNALGQVDIATNAESDAIPSESKPGCDRFTESLMMIGGLPLSNADKAEAIKRLLREAGQ